MELAFHVRYTDGRRKFDGLDHYNGAQSLLGLSQILLISMNAFFNREIITQAPSAKGFRIVLGRSKIGSWEQYLNLIITDPVVLQTATDLGKNALYDLIKWAMMAGCGAPVVLQYRKAKKVARELERKNEDLQEKLDDALKRLHSPIKHQGLSVHVMSGRQTLATFNEATLRYIETEVQEEAVHEHTMAVSRFNARTGTGRLIADMDAISVPFYPVDSISAATKRALVDSLSALTREKFEPVKVLVSRVTSVDGHLKSYRLHTAWKP